MVPEIRAPHGGAGGPGSIGGFRLHRRTSYVRARHGRGGLRYRARMSVEAANAYEELFVPSLFGEWAPRVAAAARIERGDRVLDVACGTGVLARECATRVGARGSVTGVDIDAGMLEVARRITPSATWQQADAQALPLPDETFDVVVSQFGLMFFPDRRKAIAEMLRVLCAGGRLAVAVWDVLEHHPGYLAEVELLERTAGREAADALRAPFVLGDRDALRELFVEAGAAVEIATQHGTARFPDAKTMVEADLRGWLPVMGVHLDEPQIEQVLREAPAALAPFGTRDGQVKFDSAAHIVTATKPR